MSETSEGIKKKKEHVPDEIEEAGLKGIRQEKKAEIQEAGLKGIAKETLEEEASRELKREELGSHRAKEPEEAGKETKSENRIVREPEDVERQLEAKVEKQTIPEEKFGYGAQLHKPEKALALSDEVARFRVEEQKTPAEVRRDEIHIGSKAAELQEREFQEKIREEQLVKSGKKLEAAKKVQPDLLRVKRPLTPYEMLKAAEAERLRRKEKIRKQLEAKLKGTKGSAVEQAFKTVKKFLKGKDE